MVLWFSLGYWSCQHFSNGDRVTLFHILCLHWLQVKQNSPERVVWCWFGQFIKLTFSGLPTASPGLAKQYSHWTQANSSHVTKSKLASTGGQMVLSSWASSQENHYNYELLTITKQLRRWELAEVCPVGRLGLSWAKIWTSSNSHQLKPSGWPYGTQLGPSWRIGLSWVELEVLLRTLLSWSR